VVENGAMRDIIAINVHLMQIFNSDFTENAVCCHYNDQSVGAMYEISSCVS